MTFPMVPYTTKGQGLRPAANRPAMTASLLKGKTDPAKSEAKNMPT